MSLVQISFIGGTPIADRAKRYRSTQYDFGASPTAATQFFALALAKEIKPERLMILGTSGSMWDVLIEAFELGADYDELLLNLIDAARADSVEQSALDRLAHPVSEALGVTTTLRIIPYGYTPEEQQAILQIMSDEMAEGEALALDVTHGLRHLPMLGQMSALYLQRVRQVTIQGLYYGALDRSRDGVTPVFDLRGLLAIADWVNAVNTFDKDGDYGVFAPLLAADLDQQSQLLYEAAFYERTLRPTRAKNLIKKLLKALHERSLLGIGRLFEPTLRQRLLWSQESSLYQRQRALAVDYLQRRDYIRATIYAFEATLTQELMRRGYRDFENPEYRDKASQFLKEQGTKHWQKHRRLRQLRNKLAHGDRSTQGHLTAIMDDEQKLRAELTDLIETLLPR